MLRLVRSEISLFLFSQLKWLQARQPLFPIGNGLRIVPPLRRVQANGTIPERRFNDQVGPFQATGSLGRICPFVQVALMDSIGAYLRIYCNSGSRRITHWSRGTIHHGHELRPSSSAKVGRTMNPYESPQFSETLRRRSKMPAGRFFAYLMGATALSGIATFISFCWAAGNALYQGPEQWPSTQFWFLFSNIWFHCLLALTCVLLIALLISFCAWLFRRPLASSL